MKKIHLLTIIGLFLFSIPLKASYMVLPMDEKQKDHLKAYGVTYWVIDQDIEAFWLLNYRGGSFAFKHLPRKRMPYKECKF